jgi:hypothetical protein
MYDKYSGMSWFQASSGVVVRVLDSWMNKKLRAALDKLFFINMIVAIADTHLLPCKF